MNLSSKTIMCMMMYSVEDVFHIKYRKARQLTYGKD